MAIKLDNITSHNPVTGRRSQTGKELPSEIAAEGKTEPYASSSDRVTLTKSAHNLVNLVKSTSDLSKASIERIEELRSSISDGTYKINSEAIAKNLTRFEIGL